MFNSLSALPSIPYNIMVYLATSPLAEPIWNMLAYNDYDALSKPNLTFDQKLNLVWKTGIQEDYSIFLTGLVEDAIAESRCILKIYDFLIEPNSDYKANVTYAFDFLYGGRMSLVEYEGIPVSRGDLFITTLMKVLNGANIGGVGTLVFNEDASRYSGGKYVIGNSKTFSGVCVYMTTMVGDSGVSLGCE